MTDLTKADLRERLGNIDQIRDILFGPQTREFLTRLEQLERNVANQGQELRSRIDEVRQGVTADIRSDIEKLDTKIRQLVLKDEAEKNDIGKQIETIHKRIVTVADELEEALMDDLKTSEETLDQRIKTLAAKEDEEKFELRQQVDLLSKKLASHVEALDEAIDSQTSTLRDDFLNSRDRLQTDLSDLRTQIFEELERYVSMLSEVKVSKDDMAELLFELGLRLKGSEFVPELQEVANLPDLNPPRLAEDTTPTPLESDDLAKPPVSSRKSRPRRSTRA
ncbi:coiled-coil domain-containing protein [Prochlorothrix hollandica]|uniref:Uncharacterized protein n=1 Tax=Prochlorothrix hollandica PCC 9006 = CALU 1027 TaxID=317619 RepID=A0A0M2PWK8_PROHO|nr:hypothetical protein [Prochlorothrix hollandica]KKI98756.1 hypothetical protein PROH_18180 [Prochlorothrix hollandica PCC 9006 = CALU 1027]